MSGGSQPKMFLKARQGAWILGRIIGSAVLLACVIVLPATGQTIGVDYTKLSAQQQSLFQRLAGCSSSSCPGEWKKLTSSEQLEFAGGTQALSTIRLKPNSITGLDQIDNILQIHGSEPSQPSQNQFNVETGWKASAPDQFENANGWSPHIAVLHQGQYGYQENREGNPFLGLVVLFDKDPDPRKGQFHIDFRSWFAHYCPDNGNVAANYRKYVHWYGPINGYSSIFRLEFPELMRGTLPTNAPKSENRDSAVATCFSEIEEAVQQFLTGWYRDRNFASLLDFVAQDNVYNAANLDNLGLKSPSELWMRLFSDAFESSSVRVSKLEDAIHYREPIFRDPSLKLRYVNSASLKSGAPAYAIIDPDSLPVGTIFPRLDKTRSQRESWDLQARFLDHLHEAHRSKLYVVIYATVGSGLVHETAVQYWIREGSCWKISAFQGTDW